MEPETTTLIDSSENLLEENLRLKSELKRQKELYEDSHAELIKYMIESEVTSKKLFQANKLLGKTFNSSIEIIQRIIDLRKPGYYEHSTRVAEVSKVIAQRAIKTRGKVAEIYLAARIHEIGKMSLPDNILNKPKHELNEKEIGLFKNQYHIGSNCLAKIHQFRPIARTIRHIRENVDGSGLPDGLQGEEIPIGSRIIALADFFDTRFFVVQDQNTIEEILGNMENFVGSIYDASLFAIFQEEIRRRYTDEDRPEDKKVMLSELKPGMVISRDIYTVTNVLLVPKGVTLTEHLIEKIYSYQNVDPIRSGIFITLDGENG